MTITVGELVSFGPQARGEQKKVLAMKLCTLVNRTLCPTGNFREFCRNIYFIPTSKPRAFYSLVGLRPPVGQRPPPRRHMSPSCFQVMHGRGCPNPKYHRNPGGP